MTTLAVLYAAFIRSPLASARLLDLDAEPIRGLPGVVAVFGAQNLDLPAWVPGAPLPDDVARPLVVVDRVRFVNEVLGVVVANSAEHAAAAAITASARAELGVQPVVSSPLHAAVDEVLLFPDLDTNTVLTVVTESVDTAEPLLSDAHAQGETSITTTVELTRSLIPVPDRPRALSAKWTSDGSLIVMAPTADEGLLRDHLASAYRLDPRSIEIGSSAVEPWVKPEGAHLVEVLVLPALARRFDAEVRWEPDVAELEHLNHGGGARVSTTLGGDVDGTIRSVTTHVLQDAGAYPGLGAVQPLLGSQVFTGGYAIGDASFAAASVVTNLPPVVPVPGSGMIESLLGLEVGLDRFARSIGMDPVAVRRRNLLAPSAFPFLTAGGATYEDLRLVAALDAVSTAAADAPLVSDAARPLAEGTALFVDLVAGSVDANPVSAPHGCVRVDLELTSRDPTVTVRRVCVALHPGVVLETADMRAQLVAGVRQSVRRAIARCIDPGVRIDTFGRPIPTDSSLVTSPAVPDECIDVMLLDAHEAEFGAHAVHTIDRLAEAVILGAAPAFVNALTTLFLETEVPHKGLDDRTPIVLPFDPPVKLHPPFPRTTP